jgi:hypothetical protein
MSLHAAVRHLAQEPSLPRRLRARITGLAATLAMCALLSACWVAPALAAPAPTRSADTVVVVLTPFLTWSDVLSPGGAPLRAIAQGGAVGDMNSITADSWWPLAAGGALTLGAGKWTASAPDPPATPASLQAIHAANAASLNPPDIGALGSALHAAGLKTAAVGCGNEDARSASGVRAPAALMAMDRTGHLNASLTAPSLLASDASAPFGVKADEARTLEAVRFALAEKPALLVVDSGDLERAHDATAVPAATYARNHSLAAAASMRLAADISRELRGRNAILLVVTQATDKPYFQPPYFGPTVAIGNGLRGELVSASTHRPGLVTNLDVGPTVLTALGLRVPESMIGEPLGSTDAPVDLTATIEQLQRLGTSVGAIDYTRDLLFLNNFVIFSEIVLAFCVAVALVPTLAGARRVASWLLLLVLSIPPGAWLLFTVERYPASAGAVLLALGTATLVVFVISIGVALTVRWHDHPVLPVLVLSSLTALLICLDQWLGKPFESGIFSYSIRAGWRYYGMGNEGAALLVGASILAVAAVCDLAKTSPYSRALRLLLMPVVGLIAIVTTGAPFAGANAGIAIWGAVAFGAAWAAIAGVRFTWRTIALIALAVVVIVLAIASLSLLGHSGSTHISRFFGEFGSGDFSAVRALVVRKAMNNINYLPQTPYTWLAAALCLALAALYWLGDRPLARMLRRKPALVAALVGTIAGGIAAALSEDSGVVMPALMLLAGALPLAYLALIESRAPADH